MFFFFKPNFDEITKLMKFDLVDRVTITRVLPSLYWVSSEFLVELFLHWVFVVSFYRVLTR